MQTAPAYSFSRLILLDPDRPIRTAAIMFIIMDACLIAGTLVFDGITEDHPYFTLADEGLGVEILIAILLNFTWLFTITAHALLIKQRAPHTGTPRRSYVERLLPFVGLFGLIIACFAPLLEQSDANWNPYDVSLWWWSVGWHRVLTAAIGWEGGLMIGAMLINADRLNKRAQAMPFNLFDRNAVTETAKQGLFNALVVILLPATLLPFFVDSRYWVLLAFLFGLTVSFSLIGLLFPSLGLRKRIVAEKSAALSKVEQQLIALTQSAARHEKTSDQSFLPAPDDLAQINQLLDYQAHIRAIPDWPFDRSVFARYITFLLIPLITWTGGAVAENFIGKFLD